MVVGVASRGRPGAYRAGHRLGNRLFTGVVVLDLRRPVTDMLSGYRVFSRRFVKSFPAFSREFEIETELTVHAIQMRMPLAEVDSDYKERPPGSRASCARSATAGASSRRSSNLMRNERPLLFFAIGAVPAPGRRSSSASRCSSSTSRPGSCRGSRPRSSPRRSRSSGSSRDSFVGHAARGAPAGSRDEGARLAYLRLRAAGAPSEQVTAASRALPLAGRCCCSACSSLFFALLVVGAPPARTAPVVDDLAAATSAAGAYGPSGAAAGPDGRPRRPAYTDCVAAGTGLGRAGLLGPPASAPSRMPRLDSCSGRRPTDPPRSQRGERGRRAARRTSATGPATPTLTRPALAAGRHGRACGSSPAGLLGLAPLVVMVLDRRRG